ncbi:MAG: hypothetical protein GWO27_04140, partial [Thermoplasmata archaeon]|nr:hypothetical protein [Thermoplasmata archaeon]
DLWGDAIFEKNKNEASRDKAMKAFVRAVSKKSPKTVTEEHVQLLKDSFDKAQLLEETTKKTLGKGYK